METALVFAALAGLLMAALWREPGRVTFILLGCFAAATLLSAYLPAAQLSPMLGVIDYVIVAAMLGPWAGDVDQRARMIGILSAAKLVARTFYISNPYISHWYFAAAINCGFALQIAIAGGLLDGVGRWVSNMRRPSFADAIRHIRFNKVR